METNLIKNEIKSIMAEILFTDKEVIKGDKFSDIEGLDSLAISFLIDKLEEYYAISFEPSDLLNVECLESLANSIKSKL